jgi:hypothetical protein
MRRVDRAAQLISQRSCSIVKRDRRTGERVRLRGVNTCIAKRETGHLCDIPDIDERHTPFTRGNEQSIVVEDVQPVSVTEALAKKPGRRIVRSLLWRVRWTSTAWCGTSLFFPASATDRKTTCVLLPHEPRRQTESRSNLRQRLAAGEARTTRSTLRPQDQTCASPGSLGVRLRRRRGRVPNQRNGRSRRRECSATVPQHEGCK